MPTPPLGDKFYARVHSADVACPSCGLLLRFGKGVRGTTPKAYQHKTSRLKCPSCDTVYLIGLIAWPVKTSGRLGHTRPADQLPGPRERLQLRQMIGGIWPTERIARWRAEQSNLTGPECDCVPWLGYVNPECELHKDER
jgi:hypothetical protein